MGNHTHRILNTTNAHAPVGYELVAFVFDFAFIVVVLDATKTSGSIFPKNVFTDAKVLLFPQTPKYFSILFFNRQ